MEVIVLNEMLETLVIQTTDVANELKVNNELIKFNATKKDNTVKLESEFIEKNETYCKYTFNLEDGLMLKDSYIITGKINKNSYIEDTRHYCYTKQIYELLCTKMESELVSHVLKMHDISDFVEFMNYPIETPLSWIKWNKYYSVYLDGIEPLVGKFLITIMGKKYYTIEQNAQVYIKHADTQEIVIMDKSVMIFVDKNPYTAAKFMMDNYDEIDRVLTEMKMPEMPKPENKGGCCKNKPDSECCGGYKTNSCGSGCGSGECATCDSKEKKSESGCSKDSKIEEIMKIDGLTLVMKGTKEEPKCKFSRAAVNTLNSLKMTYQTINVLENSELREQLKVYCPTYPQLWENGKFMCKGDEINESLFNLE